MHIRSFIPADAEALAELYHAAVHEIGIRDYSAAQVAVWSPRPRSAAAYLEKAADRIFLVAVSDNGELIGYGDLERDGHIDHLYCRPDHIGSGVGAAICSALEEAAIAHNIRFLFVEASEAARRLFERRGYQLEGRRDFVIDGVPIHNYRMTKCLDGLARPSA
ncbi:MAG: GNAT family N-acetyltransferase [Sphingomonas sp.]